MAEPTQFIGTHGGKDSNLEFAGDYNLPFVHLISHMGEGVSPSTHGEDIGPMVIEFNLYESVFSSSVTGSLVIVDTQNLITKLPIQGTERLSFKLTTKLETSNEDTVINCLESNGTAMHVFAVTDKRQLNDNTLTYTIQFASREFVRNLRTRVSESFNGRMDEMVNKIFTDPDYLDSQKKLYYQKTRNSDKIVVPNLNPFDAINMISKKSLSDIDGSKGAGYMFFETTKGFHFRSWESMCVDSSDRLRDSKQSFRYVLANTGNPHDNSKGAEGSDRVTEGYRNVREYKFMSNFHDVAANTALGTYGHRVITHNIYNKSYREDDYNYHNAWNQTAHLEDFPSIAHSPIDYDVNDNVAYESQKGVSDWPESRVSLQSTTQYAHGEDTGSFGTPVEDDGRLEGTRIALMNKIDSGTRLQLTVNGQGRLQAGDIIEFDLQSVENRENANASGNLLDPQYSGRYIITDIRHRVAQDKFLQVLTCVKDSSKSGFGYAGGKSFTEISGGTAKRKGMGIDISKDDERPVAKTPTSYKGWYPGA